MFKDENRHYSLRKLSVGLASVLIGISFASATGNSVKADTVNGDSNSAQTVKVNDTAIKGSDAVVKTDTESAKKDSGAITQDIKQNTAVQGSDKAEQSNTSSVVQEDSSAKGDSLADKNNALKAKAEAAKKAVAVVLRADSSETTLNLNGTDAIDPETLKENKIEAVVKADPARGIDPVKFASNGGFDPTIWGTMDTSKWQLDNNGNITGYTGDMSHIIIPNASDFAKAGKNYSQIGISSDEMRELGGKLNSKADTLAISLTDNGKVEASDTNWRSTFYNTLLKQANLEGLDTGNVTDMRNMFNGAKSLNSLDVSNWDTSNVTDMSFMFDGAGSLTSIDVSKWNTGNVTDMNYMFRNASSLTNLDVSKWDTSKVTNMSYMFRSARGLTSIDVSKWDTGNVTDMGGMFYGANGLTNLDVSTWNTGNVTDMHYMFTGAKSLNSLDVSNWDTGNVTDMRNMFDGSKSLNSLDVSNWDTSNVTDMGWLFSYANNLTNLDVSKWDTSNVTDMTSMFSYASNLTSLDVSNWNTGNVTDMSYMFNSDPNLALIVNGDKFADYLVNHDSFAYSGINSDVKSVTTDNTKLLQLLTNDSQHDSAAKTIVLTFPAGYSPDLTKYNLTKNGNTYQIKQSADYDKPYLQGTVLINATGNIAKHHIDATKPYKLSDTWQPKYDKLVLAHKNSDGSVSFDDVQLPKVPGYKAVVKTVASPVNPASTLFAVSFMALPKTAETVSPATPVAIEVAKPITTEPKVTISATPKIIDLSNDAVTTTPKETTWQVADEPDQDTYHVSNGQYAVELPHISNAQLHVIANDSTKDSILFTYKGQNSKYVFNIKFVNGHYLLTTYKVESGKLVKLIDCNFVSSIKMINVIKSWFQLK